MRTVLPPFVSTVIFTAVLSTWGLGSAQDIAPEPEGSTRQVDFARDILPILTDHCYSCHGPDRQESSFRLDSREAALGTADMGPPPIVPGQSKQSPLIEYVSGRNEDLVMPPPDEGKPLDPRQVELLTRWVDQGANWPAGLSGGATALTTDHWSFQRLSAAPPPPMAGEWGQNAIDAFILRKLRERGIEPSSPADRVTLVRRIYLDLHGLPPTSDQVEDFVQAPSPNALERLIGSVLESSHYGERWARHWLDVVRFGESTGFEVNRDRPNAYPYRDYVIQSLNEDKSYRDFIIEQLAGDAVGVDAATGFLVGGPYDMVKSPDINLTLMQRQDELADIVNTTATAFLGLTVGCARCHNHKFDPIPQQDYYALQAVFAGVEHGERQLRGPDTDRIREQLAARQAELRRHESLLQELRFRALPANDAEALLSPVNAALNLEAFAPIKAKYVRFVIRGTNGGEPCIDELEVFDDEDNNVALAAHGGSATSSGDFANNPSHKLEHINDGQYGNANSWIADTNGTGWVQIEFADVARVQRIVWGRDRNHQYEDRLATDYTIEVATIPDAWITVAGSQRRLPRNESGKEADDTFVARLPLDQAEVARQTLREAKQLREQIAGLEAELPVAYIGNFKEPDKTYRLYRGDPLAPREEVAPDALTVTGTLGLSKGTAEQLRRRALADWIASAENPLTARVVVNRVWHYHFGTGIVSTPSDFGKNGAEPSHPELLDWLARQFIDHGWSLKWLHRLILSSATYQQASTPRPDALAKDASSRLLWRFPPRRLEAEAIRDCVLRVSGKLNPKAGGPGFLLLKIDHENVHHYFPLDEFGPDQFRRMIYMTKIRQEQDDVFGIFDCPDGGQVMPDRSRSTTPLQALNLLNSTFMLQQAGFLADRLRSHRQDDPLDQIRYAFQLAFSRSPSPEELRDAVELVEQHGLESLCRALLNANEFLFIN